MRKAILIVLAGCLLMSTAACTREEEPIQQEPPAISDSAPDLAEPQASEPDTTELETADLQVIDSEGMNITAEAVALWEQANMVYNVDDTDFLYSVMADPVLLFDGAPAYCELAGYDERVEAIFTENGKAQLEQSAIGGDHALIQKRDGKVYRMAPWKTGMHYESALTGAQTVAVSGDTVTLLMKYAVPTFSDVPDETIDGAVEFTIRKVDGRWLVEDYIYPEAVILPDSGEELPEEEDGVSVPEEGQD